MRRGYLSQYFTAVAAKRLSAVEADPNTSNQHEFNGTRALQRVLGECGERVFFTTTFLWFGEENQGISSQGEVTWYDARIRHPTRSECRLYFNTTEVSQLAQEGDMMFIARRTDGTLMIIITANGTTIENQLFWLFDIEHPTRAFEFSSIEDESDIEVDFVARFILDELGIEAEEPEGDRLDELLERFGGVLPSTMIFSAFARSTIQASPRDDPDQALMIWMNQEEKLFRRMELHEVGTRLRQGFMNDGNTDVQGFISYSLQVQNRRKARAGFALENHLEAVFEAYGLRFTRGAVTENRARPDFLFPGIEEYRSERFPTELLTMLGSKTTCKDRWRQVLAEANRVTHKHLLTLEPSISQSHTDQMRAFNVQLVLPEAIHTTYNDAQRAWLMNVRNFIGVVQGKQDRI